MVFFSKSMSHSPGWESLRTNARSARLRHVTRTDCKGTSYTVFEVEGERFHGARSAIELLLRKQKTQTTYPRKKIPFGDTVFTRKLEEVPALLGRIRQLVSPDRGPEEPADAYQTEERWTKTGSCESGAVAHGVEVDLQVGKWCENVSRLAKNKATLPRESYPSLEFCHGVLQCDDVCAARTAQLIWDGLGLMPRAVQFPVYNTKMRVATLVDVVCQSRTGKEGEIWLVETKCSNNVTVEEYLGRPDPKTGKYRGPASSAVYSSPGSVFAGFPAAPVTADVMQTLMSAIILIRSYGVDPKTIRPVLLKLCKDGVAVIVVDTHLKREMRKVYDEMVAYEEAKRKKRH